MTSQDCFALRQMLSVRVSDSLFSLLKSLFLHFVFFGLLGLAGWLIHRFLTRAREAKLALIALILLIFAVFAFSPAYRWVAIQYRCLPLLLVPGALTYFIKLIKAKDPAAEGIQLFVKQYRRDD